MPLGVDVSVLSVPWTRDSWKFENWLRKDVRYFIHLPTYLQKAL
jgi:hypothetical protein